jgi:hypothetical protein
LNEKRIQINNELGSNKFKQTNELRKEDSKGYEREKLLKV